MTKATDLIAAERERQIASEGYTAEHDADHALDLVAAANGYGQHVWDLLDGFPPRAEGELPYGWPWAGAHWKPTGDPVRDLTKAGALIAAAIDSLIQRGSVLTGHEPHVSETEER